MLCENNSLVIKESVRKQTIKIHEWNGWKMRYNSGVRLSVEHATFIGICLILPPLPPSNPVARLPTPMKSKKTSPMSLIDKCSGWFVMPSEYPRFVLPHAEAATWCTTNRCIYIHVSTTHRFRLFNKQLLWFPIYLGFINRHPVFW